MSFLLNKKLLGTWRQGLLTEEWLLLLGWLLLTKASVPLIGCRSSEACSLVRHSLHGGLEKKKKNHVAPLIRKQVVSFKLHLESMYILKENVDTYTLLETKLPVLTLTLAILLTFGTGRDGRRRGRWFLHPRLEAPRGD